MFCFFKCDIHHFLNTKIGGKKENSSPFIFLFLEALIFFSVYIFKLSINTKNVTGGDDWN